MIKNTKRKAEKLQRVLNAWTTLRPTKSFAGLTLAQFRTQVQPSLDARTQMESLLDQLIQLRTQRELSDVTSNKVVKLVVNAVKGDPAEGEDGALYAAMGYVTASERQSGLTRKGQTTSVETNTAKAVN